MYRHVLPTPSYWYIVKSTTFLNLAISLKDGKLNQNQKQFAKKLGIVSLLDSGKEFHESIKFLFRADLATKR